MNEEVKQQTTLMTKPAINKAVDGLVFLAKGKIARIIADGRNASNRAKAGDFFLLSSPVGGIKSG